MASCRDCICEKTCRYNDGVNQYCIGDFGCPYFKDRSKFVDLPCRIGDTVYFIKTAFSYLPTPKAEKIRKIELYDIDIIFRTESRAFNDRAIGDTVFLTPEEAEKALEERNNA